MKGTCPRLVQRPIAAPLAGHAHACGWTQPLRCPTPAPATTSPASSPLLHVLHLAAGKRFLLRPLRPLRLALPDRREALVVWQALVLELALSQRRSLPRIPPPEDRPSARSCLVSNFLPSAIPPHPHPTSTRLAARNLPSFVGQAEQQKQTNGRRTSPLSNNTAAPTPVPGWLLWLPAGHMGTPRAPDPRRTRNLQTAASEARQSRR